MTIGARTTGSNDGGHVAYGYHPDLASLVSMLPPLDIGDLEGAREFVATMSAAMPAFVPPTSITVDQLVVPGRDGHPGVPVWVFAPKAITGLAPGLVYIHGGGFVLGDVASNAGPPALVAAEVGAVVVSVDYRLAPEHPFPAAVEDCYTALCWLANNAGRLGVDSSRLAVGGQSAGGGLAAAVALMARDRGGPALCFQLLDIPELDDRLTTESMQTFTDTPLWNRPNAIKSWDYYLGTDRDPSSTSPYAAPARADDLAGLPPAFVAVCEFDPLRDEGISYAQRLVQAGVSTELHLYPGTFHGSSGAAADAGVSVRMNRERLEALSRALACRVESDG